MDAPGDGLLEGYNLNLVPFFWEVGGGKGVHKSHH